MSEAQRQVCGAAGHWELEIMGKNGVTVNGTLHTPSATAVRLRSRDLITMGD